jgi:hypothetical protein
MSRPERRIFIDFDGYGVGPGRGAGGRAPGCGSVGGSEQRGHARDPSHLGEWASCVVTGRLPNGPRGAGDQRRSIDFVLDVARFGRLWAIQSRRRGRRRAQRHKVSTFFVPADVLPFGPRVPAARRDETVVGRKPLLAHLPLPGVAVVRPRVAAGEAGRAERSIPPLRYGMLRDTAARRPARRRRRGDRCATVGVDKEA